MMAVNAGRLVPNISARSPARRGASMMWINIRYWVSVTPDS